MSNKQTGNAGEQEVVDLIACPNCGKKLMLLPTNYPLCDVQCTACAFHPLQYWSDNNQFLEGHIFRSTFNRAFVYDEGNRQIDELRLISS